MTCMTQKIQAPETSKTITFRSGFNSKTTIEMIGWRSGGGIGPRDTCATWRGRVLLEILELLENPLGSHGRRPRPDPAKSPVKQYYRPERTERRKVGRRKRKRNKLERSDRAKEKLTWATCGSRFSDSSPPPLSASSPSTQLGKQESEKREAWQANSIYLIIYYEKPIKRINVSLTWRAGDPFTW